ncbi:MAG: hypothetical protein ACT4OT_07905 [Acidobacteriota bacterium]
MNKRLALHGFASALLVLGAASLAFGQNQRTWVSSSGSDAAACTTPATACATLAGALGKTNSGGEIVAVDGGEYGRVTITKSVTIDGQGVARVTGNVGGNAIGVAAGANDVVILRGLHLYGASAGGASVFGVQFTSGRSLQISDTQIDSFGAYGIDFEPTASLSQLIVDNVHVKSCASGGALLRSTAGNSTASLNLVRFDRGAFGLDVRDNILATVTNSHATHNSNHGFFARGPNSEINLVSSTASNNSLAGVRAESATAIIRISANTVTDNGTGLQTASGGQIVSYSDNVVAGNAINGVPTSTVPKT